MRPPAGAMALAVAGLLPFIAGALSALGLVEHPVFLLGYASGSALLLAYGKVILSFMGGALWGFAARDGAGVIPLVISVLPALWAVLLVGASLPLLALGFALLLIADFRFTAQALAPNWWMSLRIPITAVAVISLLTGAL